jgi:hypothetical protein
MIRGRIRWEAASGRSVSMGILARLAVIVAMMAVAAFSTATMADDWVATKLRGIVLQLVDGEWVKLQRGDVVPDDRAIRTMRSGRVQFTRDAETIDLGPDTQVQIVDRAGQRYTSVKQHFGTVAVEAEVMNVKHFEVVTPQLAAVVKGTKFTVFSSDDTAKVTVTRGRVAVEDRITHQSVTVAAGQSVTAADGQSLDVAGKGELPVVHDADGNPVAPADESPGTSGSGTGTPSYGLNVGVGVGGSGVSVGVGSGGVSVGASVGGLSVGVSTAAGGGGVVSGVVGTVGGLLGGLL